MALRPLHDRVVVRRAETETVTSGGILLPGNAAEKPAMGTVIAVGKGLMTKDGIQPPDVEVGDCVLFGAFAGSKFMDNGEELLIMKESDIFAVQTA